jgi:hypothetical protein
MPDIVVLDPLPDIPPGLMVQFPAGKPLNTTLPVATEQIGCVIVPTIGAEGVAAVNRTLDEAAEVHPAEFVTVKLYVPAARPETVVLEPEPDIDPGFRVQFPPGKPFKTTLPVETVQVG